MPTIEVTIKNKGRLVERTVRPVRALPGKKYGAVYRGQVYELGPNRIIDISGKAYDAERCPPLRVIPQELADEASTPAPAPVYLDESGKYPYLLLNGTRAEFQALARNLKQWKVDALSSGEAWRPADNGVQYDWFFRLNDVSLKQLARVAKDHNATRQGKKAATKPIKEPKGASPAPARKVAKTGQRRSRAEEAWPAERARLLRERNQFERKLRLAATEIEGLKAKLRSAQVRKRKSKEESRSERKGDSTVPSLPGQHHPPKSDVFPEEQAKSTGDQSDAEVWEAHARDIQTELNQERVATQRLTDECEQLRGELKSTRLELDELQSEVRRDAAATPKEDGARDPGSRARSVSLSQKRFESVVQAFFPQVKFERDSIQALWDDVGDHSDVMKKLKLIADPTQKAPMGRVDTIHGWYEKHFSNGQTNAGRLYWLRTRDHVRVLVSNKQRQRDRRDEAWLEKNK